MKYRVYFNYLQRVKEARTTKQWTIIDNPDIFIAASYWVVQEYQTEKGYQNNDPRWVEGLNELFATHRKANLNYQNNLEQLVQILESCQTEQQDLKQAIQRFIYDENFYVKGISYQTWKRFNQGDMINERAFKAYCGILELDWQTISLFNPIIDLGDAPHIPKFYGRSEELKLLKQWLVNEHSRLIGIISIGGMGKTALSVKVIRQFSPYFDVIIWRSLKNKRPFYDLLEEWLKIISQQNNSAKFEDNEQGINQLMVYLQQKRCLLILDNIESILQSDSDHSEYQEGYESYGNLCQRIIQDNNHQSCLLLTSREQPKVFNQLSNNQRFVHFLNLKGLKTQEIQRILTQRNIFQGQGSSEEWEKLNNYYDGNPLALQLVGANLQYLDYQNLSDFLNQIQNNSQFLMEQY